MQPNTIDTIAEIIKLTYHNICPPKIATTDCWITNPNKYIAYVDSPKNDTILFSFILNLKLPIKAIGIKKQ